MRYWSFSDWMFFSFIFAMIAALALLFGSFSFDAWLDRQTFSAQVACEAKQMQPRRQVFSRDVVCVPNPNRHDTTRVEVAR